jgi:hypothetical protein
MTNLPRHAPTADDLFAPPTEAAKTMNRILATARDASAGTTGSMAARASTPTGRGQELDQLVTAHAQAVQTGDEDMADGYSLMIDKLLDEARAGAQARDDQGRYAGTGFDGGVRNRGGIKAPPSSTHAETSTQIFKRAVEASRQEAAEQRAEPAQRIPFNV